MKIVPAKPWFLRGAKYDIGGKGFVIDQIVLNIHLFWEHGLHQRTTHGHKHTNSESFDFMPSHPVAFLPFCIGGVFLFFFFLGIVLDCGFWLLAFILD